jgi:tetratricopeptide (TPR) repeat protein
MSKVLSAICPACKEEAQFPYMRKREAFVCSNCEEEFSQAPVHVPPKVAQQTIFLSYAHKSEREEDFDTSEDLVLLIKEELERDGHIVWIDIDGIRSGSQWRERITAAIQEHEHFLSFLSVRSVRDPGVCLNEIALAVGGNKYIQTVLAEDERRVKPPLTISHIQWHDFQDWREIRTGAKTGPMGEDWEAWFAQRMARVREVIADQQNARIPGELQKLREVLEPRTFEARIVEKTQGFSGRAWLFEETRRWLEETTSRMFWLKAGPGIGKSSFAAQLAHQARSTVVGFFMCDFQGAKDPEESAREAVCTLAFQIASRLPDYRLKLLYTQQVDKEQIFKRTADELFEYLITEPLNRLGKIPESTRLCLVVDGLDEAGRSDGRNALAELLAKHAERLPEWLGVLVTSRPEPYLEQILKPLTSIAVDGHSTQNQQDLADWINARLPPSISGDERQGIIESVIEKSGGTFLYLSLVEKDKELDLANPTKLPDQLDGIFKQNFKRYFPDVETYAKKTELFLRLMAAAPGPLPALMGAEILGWGRRELTLNVIERMGTLLQERDGGLTFFHAALSDWLKEPKRSGTYCLDDGGAESLARFIWKQFETHEQSAWKPKVVAWLAEMMPFTPQWGETTALERAAEFLEEEYRYRNAMAVRRRQLECVERDFGSESSKAASSRRTIGYSLEQLGDSAGALAEFRKALSIVERLTAKYPDDAGWQRDLAVSYNRIGGVLEAQGDLSGAMAEFRKTLSIVERLAAQDPDNAGWQRELGVGYNRIGGVLESQGDLSGAMAEFRKTLSIVERLAAQDPDNAGWQRELGVGYNRIGGVLESQGDLSGALAQFRKTLTIVERLAAQDPDNAGWQSDLGVGYNRIGRVLESQGDLSRALAEFRKDLAIAERLAAQDPDNAGWQRDLAVSYNRIAGVLESQSDLSGALAEFRKGLAIAERLAAQDPDNAGWQRDLAVSYDRIGGVLESQGDLSGALAEFRKALSIVERLAAQDPDNAGWQSDLAGRYNRIGGVLESQGDLSGALAEFRKALSIVERLAAQDPDNAGWQSDLAGSYNRIGGVLKSQGDLPGALAEFRKGLAIAERLAAQDPDNAGWQRDLAVSYNRISGVLESQGDLSGALAQFRKTLTIAERLAAQDPDNAGCQRDLAVSYNRIGGVLESQGDLSGALAQFRKTLTIVERLAAQDPDNAGWQSDLGVGYNRIGRVLESQGNLSGALEEVSKALAIFERLTAQDPGNTGWQRELATIHDRFARVRDTQGKLDGALE